jgi:MoxR-like ATPase
VEYPRTVTELTESLRKGGYLADRGLATTLLVSLSLRRPVLLEGEVGVGKTEVAKVLAAVFGRQLIRLQCYEGITTSQALYEWDYARQMLQIRALSQAEVTDEQSVDKLFGPKFLLERPLLEAVRQGALRRRCLYHWIGYPTAAREAEIVAVREPAAARQLTRRVVAAVHRLREMDLAKPPGVAETIDWVRTLGVLGETELTPDAANDTIGAVIKDRDDLDLVRENLAEIIPGA